MKSTITWVNIACPNCGDSHLESMDNFKFDKELNILITADGDVECECGHIFTPTLYLSELTDQNETDEEAELRFHEEQYLEKDL